MSFQRDLAWERLDLIHRSSVAYQNARYALGVKYEMLPEEVIHQAKRCVLDAMGCAIGAHTAPGRPIMEDIIADLGGKPEATVYGSGLRTSALNATLINCFMERFLDANDMGGGGHNSDAIPAILAVCEREHKGGHDFLTSLVVSYELGARIYEGATKLMWEQSGYIRDARASLSMPATLGILLGLDAEQIANATGSCASGSLPLGILDTHKEEMVMRKNIRFGWGAYSAVLSCMLAKKGFTGPIRIFEGEKGISHVLFDGKMDVERITDYSGWRILETRFKYLSACSTLHGHLFATMSLVKKHDLKPEDIEFVTIKLRHWGSINEPGTGIRWPRNAESGDHSSQYATAVAIIDRAVGPDAYEPWKFTDPKVLALMERVTVVGDPTMNTNERGGLSRITTKDGRVFEEYTQRPHGFADDPLTDAELEGKFREMTDKHMDKDHQDELIQTIWNVDKLDDMNKLGQLMVFRRKSAAKAA